MKVAILGANGFVGQRLFEIWHQRGPHAPRAIVRSPTGLARVARFTTDWRIADARNAGALTRALDGCDALVHCAVGDTRVIKETVNPVFRAARDAGVNRVVYLSSAAVHGQNPAPGTSEASALRMDQPLAYNNAKVWAERRLQRLVRHSSVELVILRPGIVFGPRSRWELELAERLVNRRAYWIGGGAGICNSIYVDNLVTAVECALSVRRARGEAYLVGDAEVVTWRDLYLGIAQGLGCHEKEIHEAVPARLTSRTWIERMDAVRASDRVQRILAWMPDAPKRAVKAAWAAWRRPAAADPWRLPSDAAPPTASLEMTLLFACQTKLPHAKATAELGYAPRVSFAEGVQRSVAWLKHLNLDLPR